jgi:phage replication-related protein YjqB (UPF0714/DUF867 family)
MAKSPGVNYRSLARMLQNIVLCAVACLDGLVNHSKILTMSNHQDCTPSLLADRELRLGIGAGVPLRTRASAAAGSDLEDSAEPSALKLGYAPPFLEVDAEVRVATTLHSQAHKHDAYACSVPRSLVGLMIGDQIRITRSPDDYALYTIVERRISDNPNVLRMGLNAHQRLGTANGFEANVINPVVAIGLTDAQAQLTGEFVERLVDDGQNGGLVVLAPHGGMIEARTDRQAETVTAALACSSWICKGWKHGDGGCYRRWHISSTRLSPRSFPGLGLIANRGFDYAVAFHGISSGGGVLIGGTAPRALKVMVKAAIVAALRNPEIEVTIVQPDDDSSGGSPHNVVNWLTADGMAGLQIEQSPIVRAKYWREVANAVISVYSQLI